MQWSTIWRVTLDIGWLAILLFIFRYFWEKRRDLIEARSWLVAKGHITSCEWTTVGHSIWPKIEYLYQVYDKDLIGEYLFLDTFHNSPNSKYSRNMAYKVSLAFKNNTEIDVFYNPNRPEQSALDVSMPRKLSFILAFVSVLLVVHIILMALHYLR